MESSCGSENLVVGCGFTLPIAPVIQGDACESMQFVFQNAGDTVEELLRVVEEVGEASGFDQNASEG